MHDFTYQKVDSLMDATEAISASQGGAAIMAGGTDLLVQIKEGKIKPKKLIDVKGIHELNGLSVSGDTLSIGSLTTIRTLETSPVTAEKAALLAMAAARLGSVQVRNRATIGGNLCNASPAAEMAPALLALNAQAEIHGKAGARTVDMGEFFRGPGMTILSDGEILTSLKIPLGPIWQGAVYNRLSTRNAMDLAFVSVAVSLRLDGDGKIDQARIALGAVAPTPIRVPSVEKVLEGNVLSDEIVVESSELAAQACRPLSDIRASAEYRVEMVRNLCRRGLVSAYRQAKTLREVEEA